MLMAGEDGVAFKKGLLKSPLFFALYEAQYWQRHRACGNDSTNGSINLHMIDDRKHDKEEYSSNGK